MVLNYRRVILPINEITKSTIKMKNKIFAIPAAAPATPPNPKTPAIIATIRNMIVQRNIIKSLMVSY